ncbi:protein cramped-like isoform X1 [Danio rerio]|uniref:Protein cramped-like n=2 Tax=Danio rerio TaxID=7955 RepID=A0A8M1RIJ0_DANRE|nr:protein cramped-like isoform X1 [Danio rerio]|eukprot:XP_003198126.2 protein cramped-like isoform X1 [Danio rerio]
MVKRKKTPSASEELENGMTVGQGGGSGVEGPSKPDRKPEGGEDGESADQASEETSTKRVGEETLNPSSTASPGSAPTPSTQTSSPPGPQVNPTALSPGLAVPNNQDQHHFLRSSVRPPSKRIRKDASSPALNGHGGAKAKGAEAGPSVCVAAAAGSAGGSGAGGTSRSAPKGQGPAEKEEGGSQKRVRRQWESWSTEDKNSFFEGLYEHGKDFEAIQNNIALKYKKKGKPASMVKNKEQVRHFYYRTWHKISKHIDFNNVYSRVLKKSSQELYGLICYAELRKKVGGLMDDKNVAKLNELIQQGATTVRSKGRNLRIKAPMCRALKKICDPDGVSDEEDQKPVRLPLKVAVELQPRSNHSWARVQSLAHNPRLRMVIELHRKVSTLIEFLKQKWAVQDQRIRKSLAEREALDGLAQSSESEELFLFPAESSTVTALPGVARVVHSKASCTVHWQESGRGRTGIRDLPAAHILGIQPARGKSGKPGPVGGDSKRTDGHPVEGSDSSSTSAAGLETSANPNVNTTSPVSPTITSLLPIGPEGNPAGSAEQEPASQTQTDAGGGDKQIETVTQGDPASSEGRTDEPGTAGGVASEKALPQSEAQGRVEEVVGTGRSPQQIREEGWSSQVSENVTLAELYLMLGKPGKLQLEYEWQSKPNPPSVLPNSQNVLRCLLRLVSSEVNPKPTPEVCSVGTSPLKSGQEESSVTPPGRTPAGANRSPSWGRQQHAARSKILLNNPGGRNLPRSLLASGGDSEGFAVPTTLPPNSSRQSRMFSPNKEAELAFRQQLDSISSDIFSKQRKIGRGRPLRKPLVVQRTLLPRTAGDTSPHVCSFSILSNSSATGTGSFRPIQTRLAPNRQPSSKASSSTGSPAPVTQLSSAIDLAAKSAGIIPGSPCREVEAPSIDKAIVESEDAMGSAPAAPEMEPDILDQEPSEESLQNGVSPPSPGGGESLLAPPSVASLLDISLPGPPEESLPSGEPQTQISDSIIELAINSHYGDGSLLSPPKLNGSDRSKLLPSSCDSWMPSPTHDPQWYPNDSTDSSLGCLLSSLASPDKTRRTALPPSSSTALLGPSLLDSNSHDCFQSRGLPDAAEVDTQLACMMSESSVDYIARFNDLAQELSVTETTLPPPHGD